MTTKKDLLRDDLCQALEKHLSPNTIIDIADRTEEFVDAVAEAEQNRLKEEWGVI